MGRLRTLQPTVRQMKSKLRTLDVSHDQFRRDTVEWRKWYNTARWRRLRWNALVRDQFTCQMCGRIEGNTSLLVGDHKLAHRGDPELFWDFDNVQCLCKRCHDSDKQRTERARG